MISKNLQILGLISKNISRSLEQFIITKGQNNFGNKIPFLSNFAYFFIPGFNGLKKRNRKWFCKFSLLWLNKFSPKFLAFIPYSFHAQWVKKNFLKEYSCNFFERNISQYYQPVMLRIFGNGILLPKLF